MSRAHDRGLDWETHSEKETEELGCRLGDSLTDQDRGLVIAVSGDLGSGKTCLARGVCRGLGVVGPVTSPTFTFVNSYSARLPMLHIDLYRLEGSLDAETIGLEEMISTPSVLLVEWADRLPEALPDDRLHLRLVCHSGGERQVLGWSLGPRSASLLRRWLGSLEGPGI